MNTNLLAYMCLAETFVIFYVVIYNRKLKREHTKNGGTFYRLNELNNLRLVERLETLQGSLEEIIVLLEKGIK